MTLAVVLATGEAASAERLDGERLYLRSPRPFAPGSPVGMRARAGEAELGLVGKAQASRRLEDGLYEVRVRLLNLRRETREALSAALGLAG